MWICSKDSCWPRDRTFLSRIVPKTLYTLFSESAQSILLKFWRMIGHHKLAKVTIVNILKKLWNGTSFNFLQSNLLLFIHSENKIFRGFLLFSMVVQRNTQDPHNHLRYRARLRQVNNYCRALHLRCLYGSCLCLWYKKGTLAWNGLIEKNIFI